VVCGTVFFDDPAGLIAESLEDLVVVAVLRQLVIAVHPQPDVDFCGNGTPAPLASFVVLSLPPCRHPRSEYVCEREERGERREERGGEEGR
jgi:hypothetical protein